MRVHLGRKQCHQIDNVDDAHAQPRRMLSEPPSSGDSLSAKPRERTLDALRYRDRLLK
jgi:hypothetical protein